MRIGVLNNLRAGRSQVSVQRVLSLLSSHPDVLHVETDSAHVVPEALSDLARRDIDLLVINGGDGTVQFALTEILRNGTFKRVPMVAPLRGGRTNTVALDLGTHRDPVNGLETLIGAARAGTLSDREVDRPVLRVTSGGGRNIHYGMFFGAGVIHRAIALTHRLFPTGKSQGSFGAGMVTAGLIAKIAFRPKEGVVTPDKAQILLDGESVPYGEFSLVIASSLQRLFWRLNPFWGAEKGPVRFTCIATHADRFARSAPGILRGRPGCFVRPENGYLSRNVEHAEMRFDCGFTVDGEIFPERPDEVVTLSGDRRVTFVRA